MEKTIQTQHDINMNLKTKNYCKGFSLFSCVVSPVAVLLFFCFLVGCLFSCSDGAADNTGLGEAIDLEAPSVNITTPKDDDSVAHAFWIEGTASDNKGITRLDISFDDAGLGYSFDGSTWMKTTYENGAEVASPDVATCQKLGNTWQWKVYIDTTQKKPDKTDSKYAFSATVYDAQENSGKNSKAEKAVTLDEKDPDVTVNNPQLLFGTYEATKENAKGFELCNGSYLSKLVNGDFAVQGIQQDSLIFDEIRIEIDDGGLDSPYRLHTGDVQSLAGKVTCEQVANDAKFLDDDKTKVYLTKTLKRNQKDANGNIIQDLRNWEFLIHQDEFLSEENAELRSGKHLLRLITTSVSSSGAWERKVQGFFVWWPEADVPWISSGVLGDETYMSSGQKAIYPSSAISGFAQDDDGIESVTYKIEKRTDTGDYVLYQEKQGVILPTQENQQYLLWSIISPVDEGNYRITVDATDIYGTKSKTFVRYFDAMDTSPPKITSVATVDAQSALGDENAKLTFCGTATDDGVIQTLAVVFLDPALGGNAANKLQYIDGSRNAQWNKATLAGYMDGTNKIFLIPLDSPVFDETKKQNTYTFSHSFDIFRDLGIDGNKKTLQNLEFIFRVTDNSGQSTQTMLSVPGDSQAPLLCISSIKINHTDGTSTSYDFLDSQYLVLPKFSQGDTASIAGTWSDNSTDHWSDKSKISNVNVLWKGANILPALPNEDGSWQVAVLAPLPQTSSSSIAASIEDFAKNKATATASFSMESTDASWDTVGCKQDDGAYKTGVTLEITLNFNKPVKFEGGTDVPKLLLNNGGKATYKTGNGTNVHVFEYTVGTGTNATDADITNLGIRTFQSNGHKYKDASGSGKIVTMDIPKGDNSLEGGRNIRIDKTEPKIKSIETSTPSGYYKEGSTIAISVVFSEDVTMTNEDTASLSLSHDSSLTGGGISGLEVSGGTKGKDSLMFLYTVPASVDANPLGILSFSLKQAAIEDAAGNALNPSFSPHAFSGVIIDTTKPASPSVLMSTTDEYITQGVPSFSVGGTEKNATIEYSLNGGSSWFPYTGKVNLSNGSFSIVARQTDQAGNTSDASVAKNVTVDTTTVFNSINATTVNGTYTTGQVITGFLKFNKNVEIQGAPYVTLNIRNGATSQKTALLSKNASNLLQWMFTYAIVAGDEISSTDELLDVADWSFSSVLVTVGGRVQSVPCDFATLVSKDKRLKANKEIKIQTSSPIVQKVEIDKDGERLVVTFSKEISVASSPKDIVLKQIAQDKKVPAVLSEEQYRSIPGISSFYSKGTNGATGTQDSLEADTSTKYVLDFEKDIDDATLIGAFDSAKKFDVTIPSMNNAVTTQGNTLFVDLSSAYSLPTKGAKYELTIPQGTVTDSLNHTNVLYSATGANAIQASGIESPFIRIKKQKETITGGKATQPDTSSVKVCCATPLAVVSLKKKMQASSEQEYKPNSDDPRIGEPTFAPASWENVALQNGKADIDTSSIQGARICFEAVATKGNETSMPCYELAYKSVLLFEISDYDDDANGSAVLHTDSSVQNMWIRGGDTLITSTVAGFPVSWNEKDYKTGDAGIRLMTKVSGTDGNKGVYRWVSWDLNTQMYFRFIGGDVPSDAARNGPSSWWWSVCAWVAYNKDFPLYPGATLSMKTQGAENIKGEQRGKFTFKKVEGRGTRP